MAVLYLTPSGWTGQCGLVSPVPAQQCWERSTAFMVISSPVPGTVSKTLKDRCPLPFPSPSPNTNHRPFHFWSAIAGSASASVLVWKLQFTNNSADRFLSRDEIMSSHFKWLVNFMSIGWIDGENILNILLEMNLNCSTVIQWYTTWQTTKSI